MKKTRMTKLVEDIKALGVKEYSTNKVLELARELRGVKVYDMETMIGVEKKSTGEKVNIYLGSLYAEVTAISYHRDGEVIFY